MATRNTVLALVPDLLVASRIKETASRAGVTLVVIDSQSELGPHLPTAALLLADISAAGLDLPALAAAAAQDHAVPIIAFGRHTDTAGIRAAHEAGITRFYPRGRFLEELAGILKTELAAAHTP